MAGFDESPPFKASKKLHDIYLYYERIIVFGSITFPYLHRGSMFHICRQQYLSNASPKPNKTYATISKEHGIYKKVVYNSTSSSSLLCHFYYLKCISLICMCVCYHVKRSFVMWLFVFDHNFVKML